jgi:hypothetical protein
MTVARRIALLESVLLPRRDPEALAEGARLLIARWKLLKGTLAEDDTTLIEADLARLAPQGRCAQHPNPLIRRLGASSGYDITGTIALNRVTWAALDQIWHPQVHFTVALPPSVTAIYCEFPMARTGGQQCANCAYLIPQIKVQPTPTERWPSPQPYFVQCPLCDGAVSYNAWSRKHGTEAWRVRRNAGKEVFGKMLKLLGPPPRRLDSCSRAMGCG